LNSAASIRIYFEITVEKYLPDTFIGDGGTFCFVFRLKTYIAEPSWSVASSLVRVVTSCPSNVYWVPMNFYMVPGFRAGNTGEPRNPGYDFFMAL
jgi:hypothetical protein